MSYAVLSCDLDPVDCHLAGYGVPNVPACTLIYRSAVPRLLQLLDEIGAPAVFFAVARDADNQRRLLRELVAGGHEVASHSLTHPQPFRTLDDERLDDEVRTSRGRLGDATGTAIDGFRAPAWDVDTRVLACVRRAGYRYDASVFPTPALLLSRWATHRRGQRSRATWSMSAFRHVWAPPAPHVTGAEGLVEFPIAVTRWLRVPVYHTMTHLMPRRLFARALGSLLRSSRPLCYELHAADLLDIEMDGVDPRMVRHPGMTTPLARKRDALREILGRIRAARAVVTYREALALAA